MTDDDILREFLTEYNLIGYDGKPTAYQELSMSRYPSLAENVTPSTAAVKKFYSKHGIDFLKLFFNKTTFAKVWKEIKGDDQGGLSKLIGENIVLLENLDDSAAGELADIYLQSIKVIELDEEGWPDISKDFYYINSSLRILLKHDLKKKADDHIKRLRENLYRYYPDEDLEIPYGEILRNLTDEWIMMDVQIHGIEAVDGAFRYILFNIDTLFNEGGFRWHENLYNLLSEMISTSTECLQQVVELELKNYEEMQKKRIYDLLAAKRHPLTLQYFFSYHGIGCYNYPGVPLELPDVEYSPIQILDCLDTSLPAQTKGVLCHLMGLDDSHQKKFVENLSDIEYLVRKFIDFMSMTLELESSIIDDIELVAECAGKLICHSEDVPTTLKIIESNLMNEDWRRRAATLYIVISLSQALLHRHLVERLKEYHFLWIINRFIRELNDEYLNEYLEKPEGAYDCLKENDIFGIDEKGLFRSIRSLVEKPLDITKSGGEFR